MTNAILHHIPRRSEISLAIRPEGPVSLDPKPYIEQAIDDDAVIAAIEPHKTNGGKCGNWRIDEVRTLDIVLDYDAKHGDRISKCGLNDAQLLAALNVVLRRRYNIVNHKIVGLSERWQLGNPAKAAK